MAAVTRLMTLVDIRDGIADARGMSVSARHEAVLADGRRLLLLDDRGWSSSLLAFRDEVPDGDGRPEDVLDIWAVTSVDDIEETARVVVGPDEPFDGCSQEDMEASHWDRLAEILRRQGVIVDAHELRQLPHDVVLSERLLARVGRDPGHALAP